MIGNVEELTFTRSSLVRLETALDALRLKVSSKNPALFKAMAQTYIKEIAELRSEIDNYLGLSAAREERRDE